MWGLGSEECASALDLREACFVAIGAKRETQRAVVSTTGSHSNDNRIQGRTEAINMESCFASEKETERQRQRERERERALCSCSGSRGINTSTKQHQMVCRAQAGISCNAITCLDPAENCNTNRASPHPAPTRLGGFDRQQWYSTSKAP